MTIGPTKPTSHRIEDLPPLIIGGAVFNTQYTSNPQGMPVKELLDTAFSNGIIAIDTSPYYGPSEELIGKALKEMKSKWPRDNYFICTKAGRVKLDDFDYSRESVRKSVLRSLDRLGTTYLDLVYMHDIEFVKEDDVIEAVKELKLLKQEGLVKHIGVSGYPVKYLYQIAKRCYEDASIGPLDAILSYSNGCIQNTILFEYLDRFFDCGIKKLMNGSILSMSLLRSGITHAFHPAPEALKTRVQEVAEVLKNEGIELADVATRFALKRSLFSSGSYDRKYSIVLGLSNVAELDDAIKNYWKVQESEEEELYERVEKLLGEHMNEVWKSGIEENN